MAGVAALFLSEYRFHVILHHPELPVICHSPSPYFPPAPTPLNFFPSVLSLLIMITLSLPGLEEIMGGREKTVKHISDVKIVLISLRVKMVPVPFRFVLALELFIDFLGLGAGSQSVVPGPAAAAPGNLLQMHIHRP